jgi:hypothetical protein
MTLQTKSLLYQFLSFVALYTPFRYFVLPHTSLTGLWLPLTAFVIATLLCPVFKTIKTPGGDKLIMKWIFLKGVREIK